MSYILDMAVVAIIGLLLFFGYRRGFLQTGVQLIGSIAAFAIALSLSGPTANYVFDTYFAEGIETKMQESLASVSDGSTEDQVAAMLDGLPKPLPLLVQSNPQLSASLESLGSHVTETVDTLVTSVMETIVRPLATALLQCLVFLVLSAVLSFAAKLLVRLMKPVSRLPIIRQIDGVLGAVLGAAEGLLFTFVLIVVLQVVASTSSATSPITTHVLEDTWLVSRLVNINPLSKIIAAGWPTL